MNYVYVALNMSHMSEESRGLMMAFLQSLYEPSYVYTCGATLGFEFIPDAVRDLSLQGLDMLQAANSLAQPWEFETNDGVLKASDLVLSERQISFALQRRYALEREVKFLKDQMLANFKEEIAHMKYDMNVLRLAIVDLEAIVANLTQSTSEPSAAPALALAPQASQLQPARMQSQLPPPFAPAWLGPTSTEDGDRVNLVPLDDDTPITIRDGLPVYSSVQDEQLEAALVLAAMSFTFWSIFFVWKVWRFFTKP
jgi:hypothetical protein